MIGYIDHIDKLLFLWIQHHIRNSFFDILMPVLRYKENWLPLYLLIITLLAWKMRWQGSRIIFICILVVIANDMVGNYLIKKTVKRERPCRNEALLREFTPVIDCSSGYSFASNHASNHFALAVSLGLFFFRKRSWILLAGVGWASLIAFSQVYVGVHYPFDILAGAIAGSFIALLMHLLLKKYFNQYFVWS
jgi:membrane-associated phospholipid phosphatase